MKRTFVCSMTMVAGLMLFGGTTPVIGDERDERLNRLERRVNEMFERQQQAPQRDRPLLDRLAKHPQPGPEVRRPEVPPSAPKCPPSKCPLSKCGQCLVMGLLLLASIINILIAIWIFTDIRKRGEGHGIFIALALLAGIPTAIIYALVRIGDKKP
ncbi:MAG: hypothetical protein HZA91_15455 [Verrucomicrobia bacterium]|nr:hypothetical protein [Verrucomicrobiota bacterium]